MTTALIVANHFQFIIERSRRDASGRPINMAKHDQVIYYVISTRCEMDINGFEAVFDQLLTETELLFLIQSLHDLGVPNLENAFERAHSRLQAAGFFEDGIMVCDLENTEDSKAGFLNDIEEEIRQDDALWKLDDVLLRLIPAAK